MLNSDWPIGPVGVGTLAAPDKVESVETTMEGLWWDRPFTLDGVDIGASVATLHLMSSYGARQDIRIHTDDGGWVDRFDVDTQAPTINSWHDVDAVLSKTGARYSYQVAKVDDGHCDPVAGTNTGESLPLASIFKLYVLHAVAGAVKNGTVSWDDQLTVTDKSRAVGSSGLATACRRTCFGSHGRREDDRHQRQHGHRPADREDGHARHRARRWPRPAITTRPA